MMLCRVDRPTAADQGFQKEWDALIVGFRFGSASPPT